MTASHMWLVVIVLDNAGLDQLIFETKRIADFVKISS